MKPKILILFTAVLIVAYNAASAQKLTLQESIDTALKNNYGIIAADNAYQASRGQVYTAWGEILPSISISASANRNWPGYFDIYSLRRRTDSFAAGLNFNLTYSGMGLYTYANIDRRYHERGSSFYSLISARSNLVQQVKENYYNVVKAKMLIDVAHDAVKRSEERLRVAQSRYELGSAAMSDVLKAKVQYGNDKLDLVTRTNAYKLALANMAFTMGIDVSREFEVDATLVSGQMDISFESALDEALSKNPDYRKAQFDYGTSRDLRMISYSNLLPSLNFGLSHRTNVDRFANLLDFRQPDASYTLYASLSFNIFNGFNDYASVRAASKNVETSWENVKNIKNSVALSLRQAFLELQQAEESKKLSDESVAAAQEDVNLVKEKYKLGAATILEVLDSEVSLKQTQTNQVQAIYDYNLAISRLERAMGRQ